MKFPNMLFDSTYNFAVDCTMAGSNADIAFNKRYGRGVLVGIMGALMAMGRTFEQALNVVKQHCKHPVDMDCIPESWREEWAKPVTPAPEPTNLYDGKTDSELSA